MTYKCNNKEFKVGKGNRIEVCGRVWANTDWNSKVNNEYTRNEKCSKCGGKDISVNEK